MNTKKHSNPLPLIGLCIASLLLLSGTAHAALIPAFGLDEFPNFDADELLVAYDSDSDTLFAVGVNDVSFTQEGRTAIDGIDGTGFRLNINSPADRARAVSGTLSITGLIPELGFNSGTLLTGEVIEFGWVEGGGEASPWELQVVFAITGGDAASLFEPTGAIGLTQTDFPGGWANDWVNAGLGRSVTADYAPIPLPGAVLLLASGLLGLAGRVRQRAARA